MPNIYQGSPTSAGESFAIVVARWNNTITSKLLEGAVETLTANGVAADAIDVAWVPGAFEIPLIADQLAATGRYAAVLCLGAVIRGDTTHDQHINRAVSLGITETALRNNLPVLFGVLTCDSFEQAIQRAGGGVDQESTSDGKKQISNKGVECAEAALEMVDLLKKLS
jgi:6,7-dimethyl-8-ribityllumazine synthase